MDTLTKKTITTKRGFEYTYYVSPAAAGKPTLALHHGFPDQAEEWEDLIVNHLKPAGYGVIAPDLLGYGGTSKPTDPEAYKFGGMTADVVEIIDAEKVDKVISLGHDWGSRAAQMLYNLHPERVSGLVMVNVPWMGATKGPMDLDALLAQAQQVFGYGTFWYWKLFTADDGAKVLNENPDILFDIAHAPESWMATFCTENGMRKALENRGEGFDIKRRAYATEETKKAFIERFKRDGFDGPVCWYKSHVFGQQSEEANPDNQVVNVPSLFLGYEEDVVCRKEGILPFIQAGALPQLTNVTLNGGHWGLLEFPKEFGENVTQWLQKNYGS
ncbi:hypothetical protein N8I77_008665 [Diaporthe amygdali]|uniref:AB hydrolase-1 domain-containing protein n=1 Tax=Phomopsis amygdali TaxID=1214568 RepID=A0AAD9VZQ8_PHOAM|nr:uncharacterized protein J7T55_005107 [Diaporthe amygdali]KAJ0116161.1 hypothetical protein J7T55_005107 [Diaporthe amygdali]KAK2602105.1 hypothetical protein N8I77_008665 [Diaporthe amygdali]